MWRQLSRDKIWRSGLIQECLVCGLVILLITGFLTWNRGILMGQNADDPITDQKIQMAQQRKKDEMNKLKTLAEQLQKSSGELKEMIDQTSPHTLSLNIMKKIAEIEKTLKEIKSLTKP
jgi:hypothetical protein